jgi:hypothetical protein
VKVSELIALLEDADPDTEVRIAQQPSWPFEYVIEDAILVDSYSDVSCDECGYDWGNDHDENGCEEERPASEDLEAVVYIVEGRQLGYLPGIATKAIGWRYR